MASNYFQKDIDVQVSNESDYYLHVLIGNGQLGSTNFENLQGTTYDPDVFNAVIGKGSAIKGQNSQVISTVMVINPDTAQVIVTYYITDHLLDSKDDIADTDKVGDSGGDSETNATVIFDTTLKFS